MATFQFSTAAFGALRTRTGQVLTFAIKVGAHRRQNPQRLGLDAPRHSRRKRSDGTCRCPRRQRNSSQYALFVYIWYSVNQLVHDHNHNHIFTHCHLSWYWFDFMVFLSSLKPLLRLTWSSWCLPQVSAREGAHHRLTIGCDGSYHDTSAAVRQVARVRVRLNTLKKHISGYIYLERDS